MEEEGAFWTDAAGSNPLLRCLRAAPSHPGGELCPGKCQPRAPRVGISEETHQAGRRRRPVHPRMWEAWAVPAYLTCWLGLGWAFRDGQAGTERVAFSSAAFAPLAAGIGSESRCRPRPPGQWETLLVNMEV